MNIIPNITLILSLLVCLINGTNFTLPKFPDDFMFGVATSAYQIEGGWNEGGKSENIWEKITHNEPFRVAGETNADVTCNSYNLYERDVEMLEELGVNFYRFSIAWSRILPKGRATHINKEGIKYYNNIIDKLLSRKITPLVTLYHWDLPQILEDEGGFLNSSFPGIFEDYARVVFQAFGDRVKYWLTFNEPMEICLQGYGMADRAPRRNYHGYGEYICTANLLGAHARAYHLYNNTFRTTQNGKISIAFSFQWGEPYSNEENDGKAVSDSIEFYFGLFAHHIYSKEGGYPPEVIARVGKDRLVNPPVCPDVRNTTDFVGINHYDLYLVNRTKLKTEEYLSPSFNEDIFINELSVRRWSKLWIDLGPSGFGKMLHFVKKYCNNPMIIVTENGLPTNAGLDDRSRAWYIRRHLAEIMKVISEGVNVKGYTVWSLMDNFEWFSGYSQKYGLYQTDFNHPNKTRIPKRSAIVYKEIIRTRTIDPDYSNDEEWINGESGDQYFVSKFDTKPSLNRAIENNKNVSAIDILIEALNSQVMTYNKPFE